MSQTSEGCPRCGSYDAEFVNRVEKYTIKLRCDHCGEVWEEEG